MSEVNLHEPVSKSAAHCRRLWGVLGTAADPVVHYCCTNTITIPAPLPADADPHTQAELVREHVELVPTHRCTCGATTGEEGARLICRYREQGADACGRLISSVEQTPIGQVSMPCGHLIRKINR